ncbi:outer membrane beta-barrel protein [Henriciella aquimarina]|uniref:outer membrane beta-barrel protein n=1 Tax=Henriciella aquimarina TaxID=545261 RepID=UPI0009FD58B5|nr:outer membrane beta-barrel protein [Henriciella aquimarina]
MTKTSLFLSAAAVTASILGAAQADAQESFFERNRYVSVTERAQPEYDPIPIRLGAFEATPELRTGVGQRSNLFASSTNEVDDTFFLIAPSMDVVSTWSRHQLGASVSAEATEYADTGSESTTDLRARAFGRIDANSRFSIVGAALAEETYEPRSAAASNPAAAEPVEVNRFGGETGADYETGRVRLRGRLSYDSYDYKDVPLNGGGLLDQDFRDRDDTSANVRVSYAPRRDWAVFAEGVVTDREYDTPDTPGALNRDSTGTTVRAGVNFELPVLIRGDVAVGYHQYEYDDAAFNDIDGLSVEANASWFVTQLTTISGTATRRVIDPGLQDSAGATLTGVTLRADHELRRNLLINAEIDYAGYDFETVNRDDDRIRLGAGATWKLNRNVAVDVTYQYTDQDSNLQPFTDNRLLLALTLRP